MNPPIKQGATPEERIARAVIGIIRHARSKSFDRTRMPDVADLAEGIRIHLRREVLKAFVDGLETPSRERQKEIRKAVLEMSKLLPDADSD